MYFLVHIGYHLSCILVAIFPNRCTSALKLPILLTWLTNKCMYACETSSRLDAIAFQVLAKPFSYPKSRTKGYHVNSKKIVIDKLHQPFFQSHSTETFTYNLGVRIVTNIKIDQYLEGSSTKQEVLFSKTSHYRTYLRAIHNRR